MLSSRHLRRFISYVAAAAAVTFSATPAISLAQVADDGTIEEIVVTATKRARPLQDTPIAVTVVTQAVIEQSRITDINDLQVLVPSLRVNTSTRVNETNFSIRGFGNGGSALGTEPAVGVFIDGVFRSRPTATVLDLPRLERVEVLKGPQSTLFGKNASAGVISIVTAAPSLDESDNRVELSLGNYNQRHFKGYLSRPVSDKLALSLYASYNQRDGFASASLPEVSKHNDKDRWRSEYFLEM